MCGRYTLAHTQKEIMERFGIEQLQLEFHPRFNIAPSQVVPIVVPELASPDATPSRALEVSRWGLIPSWVKDPKLLKPIINARGETLLEKRAFKSAFTKRRCLIPADSFYEWMTIDKKKQPLRFQIEGGKLFAFAGLYEDWRSPEGEVKRTCAIVTVAANDTVAKVHNRMPAILKRDAEDTWLDNKIEDPAGLLAVLGPYDNEATSFYRVSTMVNSPKLDDRECIQPAGAIA